MVCELLEADPDPDAAAQAALDYLEPAVVAMRPKARAVDQRRSSLGQNQLSPKLFDLAA
jgi:hypothetical protein